MSTSRVVVLTVMQVLGAFIAATFGGSCAKSRVDVEKLYARRIGHTVNAAVDESDVSPPIALLHYQEELQRQIDKLPPETIGESLRLFAKMDPWLRYDLGETLLVHYRYAALPQIRAFFSDTNDPVLRGNLVRCVGTITLSRHAYGKESLALLAEALSDHRSSWHADEGPGTDETSRISELAYEVVSKIVAPEHPDVASRQYTSRTGTEKRQASLQSVGKWISQNLPYLYIDLTSGKFRLDKDAAARGHPTECLREWPPKESRAEWKLPNRLEEIRSPYEYKDKGRV